MKTFKPPKSMKFNGELFHYVSYHDKFHDANSKANKIQKGGFRIRILTKSNKHFVYKKKRSHIRKW